MKTDNRPRWTEFYSCEIPRSDLYPDSYAPHAIYRNSRYQVSVWYEGSDVHPMGKWIHLSIKDHEKSARHDWRDFQRIKNELCGPEFEAIEIYPAESRLVDTANQYHLFVFNRTIPFGFRERLVADGVSQSMPTAVQRPFEDRPADCMDGDQFDAHARKVLNR